MTCFWLVIIVGVLVVAWRLARRLVLAWLARGDAAAVSCPCGYPLGALDRARCPECGRVVNFDATPEALGLTDEQLERIARAQRQRENPSQQNATLQEEKA